MLQNYLLLLHGIETKQNEETILVFWMEYKRFVGRCFVVGGLRLVRTRTPTFVASRAHAAATRRLVGIEDCRVAHLRLFAVVCDEGASAV